MKFTFVAYGDARHYNDVHVRICASIAKTDPKFVITTGDLAVDGNKPEDWTLWRETTRELRAKTPYYTVVGDHDGDSGLYAKEFGFVDKPLHYEKTLEGIDFFFLNSKEEFEEKTQFKWLEERVAASRSQHRIAVFHVPPFVNDPPRFEQAERIKAIVHGILTRYKFCAAICSHTHAFYSTARDGVRYVITGGGGARLSRQAGGALQTGDVYRTFHHYVGFTVTDRAISARVIDDYGREDASLAFTACDHR